MIQQTISWLLLLSPVPLATFDTDQQMASTEQITVLVLLSKLRQLPTRVQSFDMDILILFYRLFP